jgi:hypothetical protein
MNMKPLGNLEIGIWLLFAVLILVVLIASLLSDTISSGDVAQAAATILAAVVAASVVGLQIARAKDQSREDQQVELKLEVYQTITPKIDGASKYITDLHSKASHLLTEVELHETTSGKVLPKTSYETLRHVHEEYFNSISEITVAIEDWGFIDNRIELFRVALACARYDVDCSWQAFLHAAMPHLKMVVVSNGENLDTFSPPSIEIQSQLKMLSSKLSNSCFDLIGYLIDFRSEMQRLLVGTLFPEGHHDMRVPKDPSVIVLRLERYQEQLAHFHTNHPLGQRMRLEKQD